MTSSPNHLVCVGLGYSARALAAQLDRQQWTVSATSRTSEGREKIRALGYHAREFSPTMFDDVLDTTHILVSAAPNADGDPLLFVAEEAIAKLSKLRWIGYLSTVGVYGNHDGAWVDETSTLKPVSERSRFRAQAEAEWANFADRTGGPVEIFRLSGIYGPGRGPFSKLRNGTARRIIKTGQVFNRIHIDDIAGVLMAAIAHRDRLGQTPCQPSNIFNVTDDLPAPPQDVLKHAAELLNLPPPPEVAFEDAELSVMGRTFYGENKRVRNAKVKSTLDYTFRHPTYREGLAAIKVLCASH